MLLSTTNNFLEYLFLGVGFSGVLFAAIGDAWKAYVKKTNSGRNARLDVSVFAIARVDHDPSRNSRILLDQYAFFGRTVLGARLGGIVLGVLMVEATAGLEQKQNDNYSRRKRRRQRSSRPPRRTKQRQYATPYYSVDEVGGLVWHAGDG